MVLFLFYAFAALTLASALVILFTRNLLHAAFSLIFCFLGVAAIYVLSGADFLGVAQIVVYVGGVLILLIFGVMLTNRISTSPVLTDLHNQFWGYLMPAGLLILLLGTLGQLALPDWAVEAQESGTMVQASTVEPLGVQLMTQYVLAFELAGILLLLALVGAATLAKPAALVNPAPGATGASAAATGSGPQKPLHP
ncbi:NADH-ubiquinone/plastoquinone oxidoreductase chain 6 [Flammeovirgaceae bacterium 311]|nr:NADH-ubiquinone/plastoquinone oxidoreductase chain 6 [Flammeovirgaceae bacterium 311]